MSFASLTMRRTTLRLLKNQFYIVVITSLTSLLIYNKSVFFACVYGGFIALSATLLSSWRITRAGNVVCTEKQQGYIEVYLGAIQKYILVLILFALGMGYLNLLAVPVIVGFATGQLAYLWIVVDTKT